MFQRLESGEDIPLEEVQANIKRFSDEQKRAIEERRFIHQRPLTGRSIAMLREARYPIGTTWHQGEAYHDFEALPSRRTEVAILPSLFLPDSNRKTLNQQLEMVAELSEELEKDGLKAIIGEAPDYVELTFNHHIATGERLFGEDYNYDYARAVTPVGSRVASVGDFGADYGLCVVGWPSGYGGSRLWAAPLVVPLETGQ